MNQSRIISRMFVCFVACITTGCTMLSAPVTGIYEKFSSQKEPPIINILCLWQPGEGRDGDGLPTRGFVGQIFFFGAGNKKPIEVDGDINVYVFDDFNIEKDDGKPLHIFEFEGGAWQNYQTNSNIGLAYQVFIPYTRKGAHQARCTLRIKYTTPEGQPVFSDAANVVLSGTPRKVNKIPLQAETVSPAQKQSPIIPTHYEVEQLQQPDASTSRVSALQALLNEKKQSEQSQRINQGESGLKSFSLNNRKSSLTDQHETHKLSSHPLLQKNNPPSSTNKRNVDEVDKAFTDTGKHPLLSKPESRHSKKTLRVYSIPLTR